MGIVKPHAQIGYLHMEQNISHQEYPNQPGERPETLNTWTRYEAENNGKVTWARDQTGEVKTATD